MKKKIRQDMHFRRMLNKTSDSNKKEEKKWTREEINEDVRKIRIRLAAME